MYLTGVRKCNETLGIAKSSLKKKKKNKRRKALKALEERDVPRARQKLCRRNALEKVVLLS